MLDDYGFPLVDPELRVCAACFNDEGLKNFVNAHADSTECSFCGATSDHEIAAPLDELVDHMRSCLERDYSDPDSAGMVYETREGGYQGEVWDTYDFVLWQLGLELPNDENDELLNTICEGLGDQLWCSAHLYTLGPDEALAYSWRTFCTLVKHKSRYFFSQSVRDFDDRELLSPSQLLSSIVDYAGASGLVRTLPAGREYFRARLQPVGKEFALPHELGPPPPEKATQNRMSPAGIVMMYVSEDASTALHETATVAGTYATGKFRTNRAVTILDLGTLPPIPSLFAELPDSLEYDPRKLLIFLHRLARDISRPIVRDDRVHIEYVPTQVVTEYVRSTKAPEKGRLDGIRYKSSRRDGGMSLVLFADTLNVIGAWKEDYPKPTSDEWLELVDRSEQTLSKATLASIDGIAAEAETDD